MEIDIFVFRNESIYNATFRWTYNLARKHTPHSIAHVKYVNTCAGLNVDKTHLPWRLTKMNYGLCAYKNLL